MHCHQIICVSCQNYYPLVGNAKEVNEKAKANNESANGLAADGHLRESIPPRDVGCVLTSPLAAFIPYIASELCFFLPSLPSMKRLLFVCQPEMTQKVFDLWKASVEKFHDPENGINIAIGPVQNWSASVSLTQPHLCLMQAYLPHLVTMTAGRTSSLRRVWTCANSTTCVATFICWSPVPRSRHSLVSFSVGAGPAAWCSEIQALSSSQPVCFASFRLWSRQKYPDGGAVKRLKDLGWLSLPGTSCAHCCWLVTTTSIHSCFQQRAIIAFWNSPVLLMDMVCVPVCRKRKSRK